MSKEFPWNYRYRYHKDKSYMTYYGQFETDKVIKTFFPDNHIGSCVEVGASHGTVSSNTLHFEQIGWKCLCIEPNPGLYSSLKVNRAHTINAAVSSAEEFELPFHIVTLSNGDETAISGLVLDQKLIETHPVKSVRTIMVPIKSLDFCLESHNFLFTDKVIDFVSVDTEGTELDVLKSVDLNKWYIKLLVVENNHDDDTEIRKYLQKFNYKKVMRYQINDFYWRVE